MVHRLHTKCRLTVSVVGGDVEGGRGRAGGGPGVGASARPPAAADAEVRALDARMPYWSPCDEVRHEAEAEGLAAALFKDDPRTNPFFVMVPRQIFAHLLIEQPKRTPQELLAI